MTDFNMTDFNMTEVGDNNSQQLTINYIHEGITCFIVFIAFLRFWRF